MFLAGLLAVSTAAAQTAGNVGSIDQIRLTTITGDGAYLLKQVGTPLLAIVWLSPECPLCQNYTQPLNEIARRYSGRLTVVGIFPGRSYTDKDYLAFREKYGVHFTLAADASKRLTAALGGTVTPEVVLLDRERRIRYRGAIDDWATGLGKHRSAASVHYLQNAIESVMAGRPASPDHTRPVGCYINDN